MSTETKQLDSSKSVYAEEVTAGSTPGLGEEGSSGRRDDGPATDYFTDAVPIRADRDEREREERMLRLEGARPRRMIPRLHLGKAIVLLLAVALAGVLFAVLGRSSAKRDLAPPTKTLPRVERPARAVAAKPVIGVAPAVAVARATRPRRERATTRRPRRRPAEPVTAVSETPAPSAPVTEPEAVEPQAPAEATPEPQPGPETGTSVAPQRVSESKSSSSTEANRQFGFGR